MSLDRVRATATADLGFACRPAVRRAARARRRPDERRFRDSEESATTSPGPGGVASVTVADGLPLDFRYRIARVSTQTDANVAPKVRLRPRDPRRRRLPGARWASRSCAGAAFTIDDVAGAGMVTVISKSLADKLFPTHGRTIGQRLTFRLARRREEAAADAHRRRCHAPTFRRRR